MESYTDNFLWVPTPPVPHLKNGDGLNLVNTWFLFDPTLPDGKADIAWFKTEVSANAAAETFVKSNNRPIAVGRLCYRLDPPKNPTRTNL